MPRALSRRQRQQNAAFLKALAETGNARLAARALGVNRSTYTKRRAKHEAFAADWETALATAQTMLQILPARSVGRVLELWIAPGNPRSCPGDTISLQHMRSMVEGSPGAKRRADGATPNPTIARTSSGRLQLRRAPPGRMTEAAEQTFLRALASTANVRLSAAAAGFSHSAFYARAAKSRAFAAEMRAALTIGYDRVEAAALQAALPEARVGDAWRRNDLPPVPPMTADQALQLLFLHERSVRQCWEKPHRRRRRGEPWETYTERLRAMWTAEKAREAEDEAIRRALCERGDAPPGERLPDLPALEQVTGWSKKDPAKRKHDPNLALFGGWRLKDWEKGKGGPS